MIKMKSIIILVLFVTTVFSVAAQKTEAFKLPPVVKNTFEKNVPGVPGKWEKENGNYEVNYKLNERDMSMLIQPDGTIIETEMGIKVSELPASTLAYMKEHYQGKTIKEAARITRADAVVNYEAEVAGTNVIFDVNGKFIKEVKD
jgi:hypothetical protein